MPANSEGLASQPPQNRFKGRLTTQRVSLVAVDYPAASSGGARHIILSGQEIPIGQPDAVSQAGPGLPAQAVQARNIHQLARRAVGLAGVEGELTFEAHHLDHGFGQGADGDVGARADVDQRAAVTLLHQVHARIGQVIGIEELAQGRARAPHHQFAVATLLGLMRLADQRRQHVAVVEVVVVVGAVQVGRHDADVLPAVLIVVGITQLDAGDLGDGVGLVGGLQRAGEQVIFFQWLGGQLGVDAAAAQEHQALHARLVRGVDQVGLDHQVLVQELGPVHVVGLDAAHLGCGNVDVIRLLRLDEIMHGALIEQIQLGPAGGNDPGVARRLQAANNGRAHHATVAGNENFGVFLHGV
jgi:hypothetical protein